VSIKENNFNDIDLQMQDEELVEIRLDDALLSKDEIRKIFSKESFAKTIATCRIGTYDDNERKGILLDAISSGADYVDVEIEADDDYKKEIVDHAKNYGCKVIVSYHNYDETPSVTELENIIRESFDDGADIAKIACRTNHKKDLSRLMSLYSFSNNEKCDDILSIGMGKMSRITRIAAPILGAPFTFASKSEGKETAEGQISKEKLLKILENFDCE
jgi:3-dehydroquinate dehydratase-1